MQNKTTVSIAPWFTVRDGAKAVEFYKSAFGAVETYRNDIPDGSIIVKLSVDGSEFWVNGLSEDNNIENPVPLGGETVRMILTTANPDELFAQALNAGAKQIYPISESHGWRLCRIEDPFGLHWEIGNMIENNI